MTGLYRKILVPLENSRFDQVILAHTKALARLTGAALVLLHVADGWVARNFKRLKLAESEEMKLDREYLETLTRDLVQDGFAVSYVLAVGEPADEIIAVAKAESVDLIAMATHGHRWLADFFLGSTADKVRHCVEIPVLMVKG